MKAKINIFLLMIFLFVFFFHLKAQEIINFKNQGALIYLNPGILFNFSDIGNGFNELLNENKSYSKFGTTIGGGILYKYKRLVTEFSYTRNFYNNLSGNKIDIDYDTRQFLFKVGFAFFDVNQWLAYPSVGYGNSEYVFKLKNKSDFLFVNNNLFIPSSKSDQIINSFNYLDLAVNVWRCFPNGSTSGLAIGVTLGYMMNVGDISKWQSFNDGFEIDELSKPKLSLLYLTISLGGGLYY